MALCLALRLQHLSGVADVEWPERGAAGSAPRYCGGDHPSLRHHDSIAAVLKRSPVFRHSISEGTSSGDAG